MKAKMTIVFGQYEQDKSREIQEKLNETYHKGVKSSPLIESVYARYMDTQKPPTLEIDFSYEETVEDIIDYLMYLQNMKAKPNVFHRTGDKGIVDMIFKKDFKYINPEYAEFQRIKNEFKDLDEAANLSCNQDVTGVQDEKVDEDGCKVEEEVFYENKVDDDETSYFYERERMEKAKAEYFDRLLDAFGLVSRLEYQNESVIDDMESLYFIEKLIRDEMKKTKP